MPFKWFVEMGHITVFHNGPNEGKITAIRQPKQSYLAKSLVSLKAVTTRVQSCLTGSKNEINDNKNAKITFIVLFKIYLLWEKSKGNFIYQSTNMRLNSRYSEFYSLPEVCTSALLKALKINLFTLKITNSPAFRSGKVHYRIFTWSLVKIPYFWSDTYHISLSNVCED